jgi:hypothetical protein
LSTARGCFERPFTHVATSRFVVPVLRPFELAHPVPWHAWTFSKQYFPSQYTFHALRPGVDCPWVHADTSLPSSAIALLIVCATHPRNIDNRYKDILRHHKVQVEKDLVVHIGGTMASGHIAPWPACGAISFSTCMHYASHVELPHPMRLIAFHPLRVIAQYHTNGWKDTFHRLHMLWQVEQRSPRNLSIVRHRRALPNNSDGTQPGPHRLLCHHDRLPSRHRQKTRLIHNAALEQVYRGKQVSLLELHRAARLRHSTCRSPRSMHILYH